MSSTAQEEKVQVSFDEECRVRVLDPDVFKHSEELEENCKAFATKMQAFNAAVHGIVAVLDAHASRIEKQKLRAIGMRNKVDGEAEHRARQRMALQVLIKEKMSELDRNNVQYQSLLRVEAEQQALIERLSNSESVAADPDGHLRK
ncbi:intraflagellar transport protein 20 [Tribonema minus]|uniref:Intraflagellar transport protein 20 n=1 Tax=Tribonema minus TaxID=303371 RepID=A0A836CJD0_9STRA|nr:intraflagellar transport protein 20 [Tribonema minus]